LNPFIQFTPIGSKTLHSRLSYLLQTYATPVPTLSFSEIEDFLVRALYSLSQPPTYPSNLKDGLIPDNQLEDAYSRDISGSIEWLLPSQKLNVPKWVCARTTEIFFEGDRAGAIPDNDEFGLVSSITQCLLRLPKDVRAKVMNTVVIVGGSAAIPGLCSRLQKQLNATWLDKYGKSDPDSVKATDQHLSNPEIPGNEPPLLISDLEPPMNTSPFKFVATNPVEAEFVGASFLGDVKVRGLLEVSREGFNNSHGRDVKDWTFVGDWGVKSVEETKRTKA
jgi:Actin